MKCFVSNGQKGFSVDFDEIFAGSALAFTSVNRGMDFMPFRLSAVTGFGLTEWGPGCPSAESLFRFPAGNRKEMGLVELEIVPPDVTSICNPADHRSSNYWT